MNFSHRKKAIVLSLLLFIILLVLFIRYSTNPENTPPNVILVSIDTLRADHLGCYNYPKNTTPNIDSFTDDCIVFTKCFAQCSSTLSSHSSMLTSLIPSHHGASFYRKDPLPKKIVTMAERLKKNGYKTASFNDGGQIDPKFGLNQGFNTYKSNKNKYDRYSFLNIVKQGIMWLEKNSNEKFFLFLHTYETHSPFTPKESYLKLMEIDYAGDLPKNTTKSIIRRINSGKLEITEADRLHILNTYDAEIRSVDDSFQYFLDYLKRMKLYDNSIIIFTSDHGEEFNEHGIMATHSHTLFNELLYVPLIIKLGRSEYSSTKIHEMVRSVDILPTVLDILNLDSRSQMDGVSLLPMIKKSPKKYELFAISERDMKETLKPECWSIIEGRWKLYNSTLYDLETDPFETIDVSDENMEIKARLRRGALRYMQQRRVLGKRAKVKLDKESIEKLKALGYIK